MPPHLRRPLSVAVVVAVMCCASLAHAQDPAPQQDPAAAPTPAPPVALRADPLALASAGVTLRAPEGWHIDLKPELLVMMDKAGDDAAAMITAATLQSTSLQGAVADFDKAVAAVVQDPTPSASPPEAVTVEGMSALWLTRAGQVKGRAVGLRGALIATPNGKVLMLLALFDATQSDAATTARAVLESVRPVAP